MLLFDSNGDEVIAVRKLEKDTLAIDAPTKLGKKIIFAVGVSAFLCSTIRLSQAPDNYLNEGAK